jgi:N-acetylglucosaminyl-diphospho-decaprenol L-rhamnosyltransferase
MRLLMPRLSIIIVTYNSRAEIDGCLESLTRTGSIQVDHEIVVVDNASNDGTAAFIRERWPGVPVIDAGGNIGFAAANNVGIRQSFGELVLLLNPDTAITPGAIDTLAAALNARPDAAVAGPRIVDGAGRPELSFGRMISPLTELRQKLLVIGNDREWPGVPTMVDRMTRVPRDVDWVSGACLLIRRADLDAVGLLDERFFLYTEDVDLCASVRARGRTVLFEPAATIVHLRGRSAASSRGATDAAYRRSQIAFYEKHHPSWAPALRLYLKLRGKI